MVILYLLLLVRGLSLKPNIPFSHYISNIIGVCSYTDFGWIWSIWCNFGASFWTPKTRKTPSECIQRGFLNLELWR